MYKSLSLRLLWRLKHMDKETRDALREKSRVTLCLYMIILVLLHFVSISKFPGSPLVDMTESFL